MMRKRIHCLELEKARRESGDSQRAQMQQNIDTRQQRIDEGSAISQAAGLGDLPLALSKALDTHKHRIDGGKRWLQALIWRVRSPRLIFACNPLTPNLSPWRPQDQFSNAQKKDTRSWRWDAGVKLYMLHKTLMPSARSANNLEHGVVNPHLTVQERDFNEITPTVQTSRNTAKQVNPYDDMGANKFSAQKVDVFIGNKQNGEVPSSLTQSPRSRLMCACHHHCFRQVRGTF